MTETTPSRIDGDNLRDTKKRKINNNDDDDDEEQLDAWSVDYAEQAFLIRSRDHLQVQKRLCEGLLQHPTSAFLNGMLLVSMVRNTVSKRIHSNATCEQRLINGLSSMYWSLFFIGTIEKRIIKAHLMERDANLFTLFYVWLEKCISEGQDKDKVIPLLLTECETLIASINEMTQKKNDDAVKRVTKAAQKLAILAPASAVETGAEKLVDKDSIICVVCLEKSRQICCVPCGHIVYCDFCSISMETCSICSAPILQKIRFFVP